VVAGKKSVTGKEEEGDEGRGWLTGRKKKARHALETGMTRLTVTSSAKVREQT
jgi:hypothetical protein